MDLYNLKNKKLNQVESKSFNVEKDIQTIVEENTQELFNIDFVSSEFPLNDFRIDSLCYDEENNSFVIIEYKKGKSYSVIDQGYSYLSLMLNNKSDFILEYNENKKNNLKRDDVDWSSSRVLFLSPSFNIYQKNSVNFKDIPFELWEIKRYTNNMISLNQHLPSSKESIQKLEGTKDSVIKDVGKEVKVFTEEDHLIENKERHHSSTTPDPEIKELYFKYKEIILNNFENSRIKPMTTYIGFCIDKKNFCDFTLYKSHLRITLGLKKGDLVDNNELCRDVSEIGHWGYGDYDIKVSDDKNFEYILSLIRQSYEKNSSS